MPGAQLDPSDVAAVARIIRDHETRIAGLEARIPLASQAVSVDRTNTIFQKNGSFTAAGPVVTITPGPSGSILVFYGAYAFPGGGPTNQSAIVAVSVTIGGVTAPVVEYDDLVLHQDAASRHLFLDALTPFEPVTITLLSRTVNGTGYDAGTGLYTSGINISGLSLVAVPL